MLTKKETSLAMTSSIMIVALVGCFPDPLVVAEDGTIRSELSASEVAEAGLGWCDIEDGDLSTMYEIPIYGARSRSVYVAYGTAFCIATSGAGIAIAERARRGARRASVSICREWSYARAFR